MNCSRRAFVCSAGLGFTAIMAAPKQAFALNPTIPVAIGAGDVLAAIVAVLGGVVIQQGVTNASDFYVQQFTAFAASLGESGSELIDSMSSLVEGAVNQGKVILSDIGTTIYQGFKQFCEWLLLQQASSTTTITMPDGATASFETVSAQTLKDVYPPGDWSSFQAGDYVPSLEVAATSSRYFNGRLPSVLTTFNDNTMSIGSVDYSGRPVYDVFIDSVEQALWIDQSPANHTETILVEGNLNLNIGNYWRTRDIPWAYSYLSEKNPYSGPLQLYVSQYVFSEDALLLVHSEASNTIDSLQCVIDLTTASVVGTVPDVIAPSIDRGQGIGFDVVDGFNDVAVDGAVAPDRVIGRDYSADVAGDIVAGGSISVPSAGSLAGAGSYADVLNGTKVGVLEGTTTVGDATLDSSISVGTSTGLESTTVGAATGGLTVEGVFTGNTSLSPQWWPDLTADFNVFPFNIPYKLSQMLSAFSGGSVSNAYVLDVPFELGQFGSYELNFDATQYADSIRPWSRLGMKLLTIVGLSYASFKLVTGRKIDND